MVIVFNFLLRYIMSYTYCKIIFIIHTILILKLVQRALIVVGGHVAGRAPPARPREPLDRLRLRAAPWLRASRVGVGVPSSWHDLSPCHCWWGVVGFWSRDSSLPVRSSAAVSWRLLLARPARRLPCPEPGEGACIFIFSPVHMRPGPTEMGPTYVAHS